MKATFAAISAIAVMAGIGCSGGDDKPKVVLGAVVDQTGNNSELSWLQAIELAVDQANQALTAEGNWMNFEFSLDAQNSENDVADGPNSRAILRIGDTVKAGAKAVAIDTTQIAEEANKPEYGWGVPMQCGSCTGGALLNATSTVDGDPQLQASRQNADRWMSRTIMSTALQAVVMSQMIHGDGDNGDLNGDGIIKVVAYGSDESFGQSTTTAIIAQVKARYTAADQSLLHFERLLHPNLADPSQIDFASDIARLTNNINEDNGNVVDGYPDYIAIATFGRNDVAFVNEMVNEGNTTKIFHFQSFRFSSNLLILGAEAEGQEGVSHVVLDGPAGDQFAADFHDKFGLVPVYRDSIYYDNAATLLLAMIMATAENGNALTIAGDRVRDFMPCTSTVAAKLITDRPTVTCSTNGDPVPVQPGVDGFRAAIRAAQAGTPIEYTGGSGPVDYDSEGNVKDKVSHFTVQNGKYVDLATFDCISDPSCPCIAATNGGSCPAASSF